MAYFIIFFLIISIGWLSNRELKKVGKEKARLENELAVKRAIFEAKILERAEQIKQYRIKHASRLERSAEFGRLSEGLFHDLMNPLTAVALHVEELDKKIDSSQAHDAATHIKKAVSASGRMAEFIKNIRSYIQTEKISDATNSTYASIPLLQHKRCDLEREIQTAVDLLGYKARQANVAVAITCDTACYIHTSPMYIHQVFLNLIANAIESYPKTEPSTDVDKARTIDINIAPTKITLADNGSGIPKEHLPHIFKPFFTTKPTHEGTGIGLHTAREIVENNFRGKIEVESVAGVGTTFTITYRP